MEGQDGDKSDQRKENTQDAQYNREVEETKRRTQRGKEDADYSMALLSNTGGQNTQLFQASATVRHCSTSFKVKIQPDHFCIGNGSYIDVHKFIWV